MKIGQIKTNESATGLTLEETDSETRIMADPYARAVKKLSKKKLRIMSQREVTLTETKQRKLREPQLIRRVRFLP